MAFQRLASLQSWRYFSSVEPVKRAKTLRVESDKALSPIE